MQNNKPTIMIHGLPTEKVKAIMGKIREVTGKEEIVFAMTTDTSLKFVVEDWINSLNKEHEDMKTMMENFRKQKLAEQDEKAQQDPGFEKL